jgi:DNA-binding transcriptional LysR family regulator
MNTTSSIQNAIAGITLRQLQYFVAVAEEEHFTHAAERLVIAQPALSRQVSDLEEVLGTDLFVRGARGVRLTDAGRELLAHARVLFTTLERAVHAVRMAGHVEFGRLRLGYYGPSFFNNAVTRTALERFRTEYPEIEVISQELFSEQLIRALRDGRIDVGISRGAVRASDIESRVIATERAVVFIAQSDPLAARESVDLAALDGRAMIVFPQETSLGLNERIADITSRAGIRLSVAQEVTQLQTMAHLVAQNDGVAILPASSAAFPFPGIAVLEIADANATIDLTAVSRRGEDSALALRFLALLDSGGDSP